MTRKDFCFVLFFFGGGGGGHKFKKHHSTTQHRMEEPEIVQLLGCYIPGS